MKKSIIFCLLLAVMVIVMLPGCTTENETPDTELAEMLGYIPYSFLEQHDILYGNLGQAKEIYGVEDVDSMEAFNQLSTEARDKFIAAWNEMAGTVPTWNNQSGDGQGGIIELTGIDVFAFDRTITINNMPPRISYIAQGDFDEELIAGKLTEQGYTKTDYGSYAYFAKGDDYRIEFTNPISKIVLAAMNRVAVLDNMLVISPAAADVTGIFDTMGRETSSITNNEICKALAKSLGNPLAAAFSTPDRLVSSVPDAEQRKVFNFTIPADWGTLQGYEMAALGYRAEGDERFFDIALYYNDKQAAEADGEEIIKRIKTYTIGGLLQGSISLDKAAFTDWWQPEDPVITATAGGAILKISCRSVSENARFILMFMGGSAMPMRDLLFLAVDPEQYVK